MSTSTDRAHRCRVVAPSGPVSTARLDRGLMALRGALGPGAEVVEAPNLRTRAGYFAGDDDERLAALHAAMADPEAGALWCARGGYGATRLLPRLDATQWATAPGHAPIVGFSDVTALLCWAWVTGQRRGVHGPVVAQLGELPAGDVARAVELAAGEVPAPLEASAESSAVLCGGTVEGPLVVGNLELLRSLVGTPWFPPLRGAILGIEEVGERPYRIDRALTQLMGSGVLRGVRGVVVGQLQGCVEPLNGGSPGADADEVIAERLGRLGVPVVTGFPFGHAPGEHQALPFGAMVRLHADDGTLECLEGIRG